MEDRTNYRFQLELAGVWPCSEVAMLSSRVDSIAIVLGYTPSVRCAEALEYEAPRS